MTKNWTPAREREQTTSSLVDWTSRVGRIRNYPGHHMIARLASRLEDLTQAKAVIASIIAPYSHVWLHSALSFLRPVDHYPGDPEALLAKRRRKLQTARELRKQENIKLR